MYDSSLGCPGHFAGILLNLRRYSRYSDIIIGKYRVDFIAPFVTVTFDYATLPIVNRLAGHLLGILA